MKKFFLTAAVALLAMAANAQTPQDVATKFNEAAAKDNAKDFAGAIPLYEEAIKMGEAAGAEAAETVKQAKERLTVMWLNQGVTLGRAKKIDEALVFLKKAADAGNPQAKGMVGPVYKTQGGLAFNNKEYAKAAEFYANAFEFMPLDQEVAITLAESYTRSGEYDKGFELFRKLIASKVWPIEGLQSRFADMLVFRANEIAATEPAKAIDLLGEAVDNFPANTNAWLLLMNTASSSNNNDKVIEYGERAAEALSADAVRRSTVYFQLGIAYAKEGNKAKAIEAYGKVTAGPNAANAKTNITALQAA